MEQVARVANGLSLQEGLLEDAFSADEAVSELLRMGTLSPQQFVSLDFNKLKTAVENLKTLATTTLSKEQDVIKNENQIKALHTFLKFYESSMSFESFPDKKTWDNDLKGIKDIDFETKKTEITTALNKVIGIKDMFDGMTGKGSNAVVLGKLVLLAKTGLQENKKLFDDFQPTMNIINQIKGKPLDASFLELLVNEYNNRKALTSDGVLSFNDWKISTDNFDAFEAVAKEFNDINTFMLSFEKLINARIAEESATSKKITSGFPNGPLDVEELLTDVSSQTLKDVLKKDGQDLQALDQMLGALRSVGAKSKTVENGWDTVGPKQEATKTVLSNQISMSANSQVGFSQKMNGLRKCEREHSPKKTDDISSVKKAYDSIVAINNVFNLKALEQMDRLKSLPALSLALKDVDALSTSDTEKINSKTKELQDNPGVQAERKLVDDAIAELRQLEQLTTTTEAVKLRDKRNCKISVTVVPAGLLPKLEASATTIKGHFATIDAGLEDVEMNRKNAADSDALGLRDCFTGVLGNDNTVMDMLGELQNIRDKMDTSVFSDATSTIDTFANSKSSLEEVRKAAAEMKNVDDNAKKLLAHFKNSQKEVAQFGTAVRGLRKLLTADKKRTELNALMGDVDFIQTAADANKSSLDQQDMGNLKKFATVKNDLTVMYGKIDNLKGSLGAVQQEDMKTFGAVFQSATLVPDVVYDAKELKKSLAKLKTLDTTLDTDALDASLDELAELDLQFSSYKLGQAPAALTSLESFFDNFFGSISKPASQQPQGPAVPRRGQLNGSPASLPVDAAEGGGVPGWLVALIVVGLFGLFALVVFLVWRWRKNQKAPPAELHLDRTQIESPPERSLQVEDTQMSIKSIFDHKFSIAVTSKAWMMQTQQDKVPTALGWAKSLKNAVDAHSVINAKYQSKADPRQTRDSTLFRVDTAVTVSEFGNEGNFIHANFMMFGKITWIIAQAPIGERELLGRVSTVEKFWAMVEQREVGVIARLCDFEETIIPERQRFVRQCAAKVKSCGVYYSMKEGGTNEFGRYQLKTVKVSPVENVFSDPNDAKLINLATVEFINTKEKDAKPKTVDILSFTGWPEFSALENPDTALEILAFLEAYKKNVIVHCSDGIGRAPTLVGIKKGLEMCKKKAATKRERMTLIEVVMAMREVRMQAVDDYKQFLFLLIAIFRGLLKREDMEEVPLYDELLFYHLRVLFEDYQAKMRIERGMNENGVSSGFFDIDVKMGLFFRDAAHRRDETHECAKFMKALKQDRTTPRALMTQINKHDRKVWEQLKFARRNRENAAKAKRDAKRKQLAKLNRKCRMMAEQTKKAPTVENGNKTVVDENQMVQDGNKTVEDGSNMVQDGNKTVEDGSNMVQDGKNPVVDGNQMIQDGNKTVEEGNNPVVDGNKMVQDGNNPVVDGNKPVEDGNKPVVDGNKPVVDGSKAVQDGSKEVQDGNKVVQDGNKVVQDGSKAVVDGNKPAHEDKQQ